MFIASRGLQFLSIDSWKGSDGTSLLPHIHFLGPILVPAYDGALIRSLCPRDFDMPNSMLSRLIQSNTIYIITRIKAHCCIHTMGSSPYLLD